MSGAFAATTLGLALSLVACASPPPVPDEDERPRTVDLVIDIDVGRDPGTLFWDREVHAALSDGHGWRREWITPEDGGVARVPGGAFQLDVWTVVMSDMLECRTDSSAALETCFAPILGKGHVCSLILNAEPRTEVAVRFGIFEGERCTLDRVAP